MDKVSIFKKTQEEKLSIIGFEIIKSMFLEHVKNNRAKFYAKMKE